MGDHDVDIQQASDVRRTRRPGRRRWLAIASVALLIGALTVGGTVAAESGSPAGDGSLRESFLTRLANNLGIGRDQLDEAITTAGAETIDEAVTSGALTQTQGDALKQRLENGNLFRLNLRHGRIGSGLFGHGDGMATVAATLGISTDDLRAELESGSTLDEVITAHGSSVEAVVDALVAEATVDLDQAVANGTLTQAQADQILANLPDQLTQAIENGFPCGPRMDHHHSAGPDDASPETTEATPTL